MTQAAFARAVLSDAPAPVGAGRFEVYRDSVTSSLTATLREAFPVIDRLVGRAFFDAMAREFVRAHPPRSPVMALYGDALPAWIARFAPLTALPWMSEVAAIEQARREATHAADAPVLDPSRLAMLPGDALAALRLAPHPSARLLTTRHPALSIWARNAGQPALQDAPAGEVLIARPALALTIQPAPPGTAAALTALAEGQPLGAALPSGGDHGAILACLFSAGALTERTSDD